MKNKLMAVLLLLSQMIITSPTKLTKEDLQKTIADFQQFKDSYLSSSSSNAERLALFSPEDTRSKHRCLHNGDDRQYFYPSTQSNSVSYSSHLVRQRLMEGTRQATENESWYGSFSAGPR